MPLSDFVISIDRHADGATGRKRQARGKKPFADPVRLGLRLSCLGSNTWIPLPHSMLARHPNKTESQGGDMQASENTDEAELSWMLLAALGEVAVKHL